MSKSLLLLYKNHFKIYAFHFTITVVFGEQFYFTLLIVSMQRYFFKKKFQYKINY